MGRKNNRSLNIITDSTRAIRNIIAGRIPKSSTRIFPKGLEKIHSITWCPAHEGLEGNETADSYARNLTFRCESDHSYALPSYETYGERLLQKRLQRRILPTPHKELCAQDAQTLRKIQTNTYPHKSRLALMFPNKYNDECFKCNDKANLFHATWNCPIIWQTQNDLHFSLETWEAALASHALQDQLELIHRAKAGAIATGVLDLGLRS